MENNTFENKTFENKTFENKITALHNLYLFRMDVLKASDSFFKINKLTQRKNELLNKGHKTPWKIFILSWLFIGCPLSFGTWALAMLLTQNSNNFKPTMLGMFIAFTLIFSIALCYMLYIDEKSKLISEQEDNELKDIYNQMIIETKRIDNRYESSNKILPREMFNIQLINEIVQLIESDRALTIEQAVNIKKLSKN